MFCFVLQEKIEQLSMKNTIKKYNEKYNVEIKLIKLTYIDSFWNMTGSMFVTEMKEVFHL